MYYLISIYLCASSLYNICYISLCHSLELEEHIPNLDYYLLAHITTIEESNSKIEQSLFKHILV
jgi:hypothetical protein